MVRPIRSGMGLFVIIIGSTLIGLAIWDFNQDVRALNCDLIWGEFVKGPFVIQTLLLVVWFIVSIKPNLSRLEEFRFLLSLPIEPQSVFSLFYLSDIFRFSWIPILLSVSLLGLFPVSSLAFLSRPILFGVISFLFFLALMSCLQLVICFKSRKFGSANYLTKFDPFIQGAVIIVFEGALLLIMLIPISIPDLGYWVILLALAISSFFLVFAAERLFVKLYAANYWMKASSSSENSGELNDSFLVKIMRKRMVMSNPLLLKNMIQSRRSRTRFSNLLLTTGFVSAAYLMAMNNQNWDDSISVLLGMNILYIVLFSSATINRFSTEFESTKIIFTLPISRLQFYFSVFIPTLTWVVLVSSVMAFLIVVAGSDLISAVRFWLKSLLAAILLLTIAINCGVANYPNLKISHKHFVYWLLGLIITCALYYKYRIQIAVTTALLSCIPVLKVSLFRMPQQLTKQSFI